jgi:hypothetical protein
MMVRVDTAIPPLAVTADVVSCFITIQASFRPSNSEVASKTSSSFGMPVLA